MENRREVIQQLHQQLKDQELGQDTGVYLRDFRIDESKEKLPVTGPPPHLFVLQLEVTEPIVNEDMIQKAMAAYYDVVKDAAAVDSFKVESIKYTGGLSGLDGINILDPHTNLFPAYIRHFYVLPSYILTIPQKISNSVYWLNETAVDQIKKFFHATRMQQGVMSRANVRLKQLKRVRLKVPLRDRGEDKVIIHSTLSDEVNPPHATIDINQNYKIVPTISYEPQMQTFRIDDQDRESFLALNDDEKKYVARKSFYAFVHMCKEYGIKVENGPYEHNYEPNEITI